VFHLNVRAGNQPPTDVKSIYIRSNGIQNFITNLKLLQLRNVWFKKEERNFANATFPGSISPETLKKIKSKR